MVELDRAKRKAVGSRCRYKICAVALDKDGEVLGYYRNDPRFSRRGGSRHAEMNAMRAHGVDCKIILLLRWNRGGTPKPIHPCPACAAKAKDLGIKIVSMIEEES